MYPPAQKPPDLDVSGNAVPPDLDDAGNPVQPPDLDDTGKPVNTSMPPAPESFLSSAWRNISEPLTNLPSRIMKGAGDMLDMVPTMQETGQGGVRDYLANVDAKAKGFFQGALEGVGNLGDAMTSPLSLATMGAGGLEYGAAKAGLPRIAEIANLFQKGSGALTAGHGATTILDPESTLAERGMGLTELAGGVASAAHPTIQPNKPKIAPIETPTPKTFGANIPDTIAVEQMPPADLSQFSPDGLAKLDAMMQQGLSPAELASLEGGPLAPPNQPVKAAIDTARGKLPKADVTPIGQVFILKQAKATPELVKQAKEKGYEFLGLNDKGDFRFKKIASEGETQPILEGEIGEVRPTPSNAAEQLGPVTDTRKGTIAEEIFNLPRGLQASMDFSAPLRQGLGLVHKPEFWKALPGMFKAWASEEGFRAIQDEISNRPLFKERAGPNGKILPSFADEAGLKLTDLTDITKREENMVSTWAEKVPGVRRSNRAYTAFLNKLRADTFDSLVQSGKVFGADAQVNIPLARELANFVNVASGRGSLGKLESSAVALNSLLFSPRLISSRLTMLNPRYYIMANPVVRKEAIKSLLAVATAGNIVTQLGKMAGGSVSGDPSSSDFGKLKLGNTRVDPFGGFQQYIVAASRLMGGKVTSSTSGKEYDLSNPQGPYDPSRLDIMTRFARGKLHPMLAFAWSILDGQKEMTGQPMNFTTSNPMENAVAQRFIPILMQDMYDLAQNDELPPELRALIAAGSTFGMGQQTYSGQ